MRIGCALIALVCVLGPNTAPALPGSGSDDVAMKIIVEQESDALSFFVAMPAAQMETILGATPHLVFSDAGRLPLEQFQEDGSFDLADQVFARVQGQADATDVAFQSMSMMLHPNTAALPFDDPLEGLMSTSVCGTEIAPQDRVPDKLTTYYGGMFLDQTPEATISLTFPATGRAPVPVLLRQFSDGVFQMERPVILNDGATLRLNAPLGDAAANLPVPQPLRPMQSSLWSPRMMALGALVLAGVLAGIGLWSARGPKTRVFFG